MEIMKDSGIEWIGEIPAEWDINKIKYLSVLKGRIGWQGLTSDEYTDEGAYLITGVDFSNGGIDWTSCVHVPMHRWEEAKEIQIENGDLLITKDGTIGKVAVVTECPGPTSLNSGVLRISTYEGYDRKFLYWVLKSDVFWTWFADKNAGNSTIQHLYQGDFAEFKYAVPSLKEQQAIAKFLDTQCAKIDDVIADIAKQIELLQQYKKSLITETVTKGLDKSVPMKDSGVEWIGEIPEHWGIKRLGYSSFMQNGYVGPTQGILVSDGVKYIQSLHVKDGEIKFRDDFFVTEQWGKSHPKIYTGDILIVQTGEIGQIALVEETYNQCNCHALIICRVHKELLISEYLKYYFMSYAGNRELIRYETGTTLKHLNSSKIKYSKVIIPTKGEQQDIVDFLDKKCAQIDSILESKRKQLETITEHKKSLIYEYVTGKKRVKEVQ